MVYIVNFNFIFSSPCQNDVSGLLAYSLKVCMSLMQNKKFRNDVLRVLVKLYMNLEKPDFINVCQVTTGLFFFYISLFAVITFFQVTFLPKIMLNIVFLHNL